MSRRYALTAEQLRNLTGGRPEISRPAIVMRKQFESGLSGKTRVQFREVVGIVNPKDKLTAKSAQIKQGRKNRLHRFIPPDRLAKGQEGCVRIGPSKLRKRGQSSIVRVHHWDVITL